MLPIQQFSPGVIAEIIRRQPPSKERTTFAWQIAVGTAVARTAAVEIDEHGALTVRARDAHWAREIKRASPTILARMQHLLGAETVTAMKVDAPR
jgi:predicted nucleic acid-binding Zn ribbon protein